MDDYTNVINRYEKKYLISLQQYHLLKNAIDHKMKHDRYGLSTICSVYFDTPDYRLIRASAEKPIYKEKLRLRSYGVPNDGDDVFLELKRKFKGIVYKRRIGLTYKQSNEYIYNNNICFKQSQISDEIAAMMKFYKDLAPSMFISYDRLALYCAEDPQLRITFDKNILARTEKLKLSCGVWGEAVLPEYRALMEIKLSGAFPMWLSNILSDLAIYPQSFSKYQNAYKMLILNTDTKKGGINCA